MKPSQTSIRRGPSGDNATDTAAIPNALSRRTSAGTGRTVSENGALNGPLGLAIAPATKAVYFVDDGTNTLNLSH